MGNTSMSMSMWMGDEETLNNGVEKLFLYRKVSSSIRR